MYLACSGPQRKCHFGSDAKALSWDCRSAQYSITEYCLPGLALALPLCTLLLHTRLKNDSDGPAAALLRRPSAC